MRQGALVLPLTMTRSSVSYLGVCAGALFACRTIFAMVSARWLNLGPEPGVLASFGLSVVLMTAAMLAAIGEHAATMAWAVRARPVRWVLLYLAFSGCSLLWGLSTSPATSVIYWGGLVCDVGIVLLLVRACSAERTAHSLMRGFVYGTCVLAAIAWMMPVERDLRLGDMEYFNTNQIANLCALALMMCNLLVIRRKGRWRVVTLFLGITLFRSLSKSTLIAFMAAQAYLLFRDRSMSRRRKWLLVVAPIVVVVCFWGLLDAYYGIYTATGNEAETLTGRTAIWVWALDAGLSRPWFGNGLDAMWKVAPPFGGELFEARHAENELLQQFFAFGICGIVLLVGAYGSLYRETRALRGAERSALTAFLVFVIVRGFAEAEPFDLLLPLWLITALALLMRTEMEPRNSLAVPATQVC
jgi:exopolysaccharide production protein ExoQ